MPARKGHILVIDDAALVRLYYRQTLEAAGYVVGEALNGLEALEQLLENPASLLILDINMPQMDGLSFLRSVRSQQLPLAAIPTLMTSTESRATDFAAARDAGANFYLTKTVNREVLIQYVELLSGIPSATEASR